MDLTELTVTLAGLAGPSGFEGPVGEYAAAWLAPFADEVKRDVLGNVMAFKRCGAAGAKTVMLAAHIDAIGFVVTGAANGFLSIDTLGGVDLRMLPAREVMVLTDPPLFGVIDTMPPHVLSEAEQGRAIEKKKLCIDVGLSQEEAVRRVPIGTPVVYAAACGPLGEDKLCGKALDDRSCAAIIMQAFAALSEKDLNVDLCCLLSTQEEVGMRGAAVAANAVGPDAAIVVDVTHAKTPDGPEAPCQCGKGAAIGIGPNMNPALTRELRRLAEEKAIAFQLEAVPGGHSGTDAAAIQIAREGVATALISLPMKYMHTPVEVVSLADMQAVLALIVAYIEGLEG